MWTRRTEQANFVANIVILHEEQVTIDYMLIEVPSNSLIQERRKPLKEGFNDAWRKVCSYSCLRTHKRSALETLKRGTHLIVAQLVLDLIFPQKRIQLDHICNIGIVLICRAIETQYKRAGLTFHLVKRGNWGGEGVRRAGGHGREGGGGDTNGKQDRRCHILYLLDIGYRKKDSQIYREPS
jgi:hypothetical protein